MQEVVITGLGIACPIGIGQEAVWSSLEEGRCGIRTVSHFVESGFPVTVGGEILDFDAKQYVKPRKSLKVMCRETQLAFAAAELAWEDARLAEIEATLDRDRFGVVLGANVFRSDLEELVPLYREAERDGQFDFNRWGSAMKQLYPLWMLKYLPNMAACHVGIAKDARGPNNTMTEGDVSSQMAVIEAADYVARGAADVMLTGAAGSMLSWVDVVWHGGARLSRNPAPTEACRPFDRARDGSVMSEGAAVFVLESRAHAEQRGVPILGTIRGFGRRMEAVPRGQFATGQAIERSIRATLQSAGVGLDEVGFVSAHGLGTPEDDAIESRAIVEALGEIPVTAPKSFVGNAGASGGAIDLAIALVSLQRNLVPPTLNCSDPDCHVNVVTTKQFARHPSFLALSHKLTGQSTAIYITRD